MAELTPIPAEHRKVYYDALLAGRAEAERLGYPMLDDRIFAAFDRAQRGPMVELIVAATRRQDDAVLLDVVIRHQPGPDACACGYDAGGHGAHVIERYQSARTAAIARGRGETGGGQ